MWFDVALRPAPGRSARGSVPQTVADEKVCFSRMLLSSKQHETNMAHPGVCGRYVNDDPWRTTLHRHHAPFLVMKSFETACRKMVLFIMQAIKGNEPERCVRSNYCLQR